MVDADRRRDVAAGDAEATFTEWRVNVWHEMFL
jgi:hypothetical protein